MRLAEGTQDSIIQQFKQVMSVYEDLKSSCAALKQECEGIKDLDFDAEYLNDFVSEELFDRLKNMKGSILDEFYPVYDDANETDDELAGEKYRNSVKVRDEIFKEFF